MTDGEKMIWAAAFSGEITRRLHAATPWPALQPDDANVAARLACRVVNALRFGVNLSAESPEADAMWREMTLLDEETP